MLKGKRGSEGISINFGCDRCACTHSAGTLLFQVNLRWRHGSAGGRGLGGRATASRRTCRVVVVEEEGTGGGERGVQVACVRARAHVCVCVCVCVCLCVCVCKGRRGSALIQVNGREADFDRFAARTRPPGCGAAKSANKKLNPNAHLPDSVVSSLALESRTRPTCLPLPGGTLTTKQQTHQHAHVNVPDVS